MMRMTRLCVATLRFAEQTVRLALCKVLDSLPWILGFQCSVGSDRFAPVVLLMRPNLGEETVSTASPRGALGDHQLYWMTEGGRERMDTFLFGETKLFFLSFESVYRCAVKFYILKSNPSSPTPKPRSLEYFF